MNVNKNTCIQWTNDSSVIDNRYVSVKFGSENSAKQFIIRKDTLAAKSPVFRQALSSSGDGHSTIRTQLEMPEVTEQGFMHFLRWLSGAQLRINNMEEAVEALQVAVKFNIDQFTSLCRRYIIDNLSSSNVIVVMDNCQSVNLDEEIMNRCLAICERETSGVIHSPAFLEATSHTVESIVKCPRLILDCEEELYETVLRWGKAECARKNVEPSEINLRTALDDILPHIKYLDMIKSQFKQVVFGTEMFTREEQMFTLNLLSDETIFVDADFHNGAGRIFKGYARLIGSTVHTKTSFLIMPEMEFYVSLTVVTGTIQVDKMVFCDINTSYSPNFSVKGKFEVSNAFTRKETSVIFEGDTKVEASKLTLKCPSSLTAHSGETVKITATIMEGPTVFSALYFRGQYTFLFEGVKIKFRDGVEKPSHRSKIRHELSELHVFYKRF